MPFVYEDIAQYVRDHADDPLAITKTMTAWIYTSRFPFGDPTGQGRKANLHTIQDLETTLFGACGFMRELLEEFLLEAGIQTRRVNFWDVAIQGGHTALEAKIGGKWMFFDPTLGLYFESKSGGDPLSIEEVRAQWPDVMAKSASGLLGWTGVMIDPATIDPLTVYTSHPEPFFEHPGLVALGYAEGVGVELNSLVLGDGTTVYVNGVETLASDGPRSVKTLYDRPADYTYKKYSQYHGTLGQFDWEINQRSYDALGRLDTQWISYDDRKTRYLDYDQANEFDWTQITTQTYFYHHKNIVTTLYDNGRKTVWKNDWPTPQNWAWQEADYSKGGALEHVQVHFDDGTHYRFYADPVNFVWRTNITLSFNADGTPNNALVNFDDGTSATATFGAPIVGIGDDVIIGTAGDDVIIGTAADESMVGLEGIDFMAGGSGSDTYYVDHAGDFMLEHKDEGTDTVNSSVSFLLPDHVEYLYLLGTAYRAAGNHLDNILVGSDQANRIDGVGGDDWILGGGGNDTIVAGEGADRIEGGLGQDTLFGHPGADTFIWRAVADSSASSGAADIVMDFQPGDKLDLSSIDANVDLAGIQDFTFIGMKAITAPGQVRYLTAGTETRLLISNDADIAPETLIRVNGTKAPAADWFIF